MSIWGRKDKATIERWIRRDRKNLCDNVSLMTHTILELENQIKELRDRLTTKDEELLNKHIELNFARAAEAHLKGYVERVRELDLKPGEPLGGIGVDE